MYLFYLQPACFLKCLVVNVSLTKSVCFGWVFFFQCWGIKPKVLGKIGMWSTTGLSTQPHYILRSQCVEHFGNVQRVSTVCYSTLLGPKDPEEHVVGKDPKHLWESKEDSHLTSQQASQRRQECLFLKIFIFLLQVYECSACMYISGQHM